MRPAFLHLDDALEGQAALLDRGADCGGRTIDARALGPSLRLWSRPAALERLREQLRLHPYNVEDPDVFFSGSGDFHHIAHLLIERAIEAEPAPTTVLHFDNHPDWVKFGNGMHCGSWAASAARIPNVHRLISIGMCSADVQGHRTREADLSVIEEDRAELYAYALADAREALELCGHRWPTIETIGESDFPDFIVTRIETANVYITIDKDVLQAVDAVTNWDQGRTSLKFLETVLRKVGAARHLIGADIVGDWSTPVYGDTILAKCIKRGEALLDQPWKRPDGDIARATNERVNLRLFDFFAENLG